MARPQVEAEPVHATFVTIHLALRFAGYLYEMGIIPLVKERNELGLVEAQCSKAETNKVIFAYYLVKEWCHRA